MNLRKCLKLVKVKLLYRYLLDISKKKKNIKKRLLDNKTTMTISVSRIQYKF